MGSREEIVAFSDMLFVPLVAAGVALVILALGMSVWISGSATNDCRFACGSAGVKLSNGALCECYEPADG